jgi:DNA polymerase V
VSGYSSQFICGRKNSTNHKRALLSTIDNVNFSMRSDIIKFVASGIKRNWKMRMELPSPRYTTRWDELMNAQ